MSSNFLTSEFILNFLSNVEFLQGLDKPLLSTLAKHLHLKRIKSGEILVNQGSPGECVYFIVNGRMRVFVNYGTPNEVIVGEAGAGHTVGEMALLLDTPRSATAVAVRDSILLQLDKKDFDVIVQQNPLLGMKIATSAVKSLDKAQHNLHKKTKTNHIKTILLLPLADDPKINDFILMLVKRLQAERKLLYVTASFIKHETGFDIQDKESNEDFSPELINWLNEQENIYDLLVYQADFDNLNWVELCKRQSDKIYLFGFQDDEMAVNKAFPCLLASKHLLLHMTLILLHRTKRAAYNGTSSWLQKFKVTDYHHIAYQDDSDLARLVRIILGKSIALVLSGGGARGLAHIGLIKALEELKIPIDYVGGTSMGSVLAGLIASGYDSEGIKSLTKKFSKVAEALNYTFPYLALTSGKAMTEFLRDIFDERNIEDLSMRSFYVSTNLTNNRVEKHLEGLLWEAVRASVSLPVIYPPFITNESLLIDGGIINNLPVDIMAEIFKPDFIMASTIHSGNNQIYDLTATPPGAWKILTNLLNPFAEKKRISYMGDIIVNAMILNSSIHQQAMEATADFCFRHDMTQFETMDFSKYQSIIDAGYLEAITQLPHLNLPD